MSSGVITSEPTPDWRGDTLIAAATTGATVLSVRDATDFDTKFAEARYLVAGDETTPREYVAVDKDANTITLAAAVGGTGLELDLPIVLWDPTVGMTGAKVVEYEAWVRLHDGSGSIPVVIPHEQIPFSGVSGLVGASVELAEDSGGDWYVARIIGREPVFDQTFATAPRSATYWQTDLSIADSTWTTLSANWFFADAVGDRVRFNATTGRFIFEVDGRYEIKLGATFAASGVGSRALRYHLWAIDGTDLGATRKVKFAADSTGATAIETAQEHPFYAGMGISLEAWQDSTGSLAVKGSDVLGGATPLTDYVIRRVGPL